MFLEACPVKQILFQGPVPYPERKQGDVPFLNPKIHEVALEKEDQEDLGAHILMIENVADVPGVEAIVSVVHIREDVRVPDDETDLQEDVEDIDLEMDEKIPPKVVV